MRNYVCYVNIFAEYKQSPQPALSVHCPPPLHPTPLCSASSDTAQSTLPTSVWHPLPILPSVFGYSACCSYHSLSLPPPMPSPLPRQKEKGKWEREGKVGNEGTIVLVYWWMDLGNSHMPLTILLYLCCMHKYFFSIHLLPFTFSALPTPLWGCI